MIENELPGINDAGGINGYKVELVILMNKGDPKVIEAYQGK
jgi:ABC-type branched-subunit amino acid transport system substrate-binding protein